MLRRCRLFTIWSTPRCGPTPGGNDFSASFAFSLSSSSTLLGVGGGLGVVLRDPQGERALIPAERKLGFVSGVDIMSNGERVPLPVSALNQLL